MYRQCSNQTLSPPIFSALCDNWRIASSLCSDDSSIATAAGFCDQLQTPYMSASQFRSCLRPYSGLVSTSKLRDLHLEACEQMEGYEGPTMAGCDTCTPDSCPDVLASYMAGCVDMPMGQCTPKEAFCSSDAAPSGRAAAVLCLRDKSGIVAPPRPPSPPPESPSPPPASPPPPTINCVLNSSLPVCADFAYPAASIGADLTSLCTAMPYMPGCAVGAACQTGKVTGMFCAPFSLLASICADMPGMTGCRAYRTLCAAGSVVQQCAAFPAIPGLPTTKQAQVAVDELCKGKTDSDECDACSQSVCDDYVATIVNLCAAAPASEACGLYRTWCAASAAWAATGDIGVFCRPSGVYGVLSPPSPPAAVSSPPPPAAPACVLNSSLPECAGYTYPLESIVADITNLCTAMPYMPGCTVGLACQTGKVTGMFCAPFSLLASICADMPGMTGCRAYRTLCAAGSVVPQCAAFPAIPGLPSTMQAEAAVEGLCKDSDKAECEACNSQTCADYLAPIVSLCAATPAIEGCDLYRTWCAASAAWAATGDIGVFCRPSGVYGVPPPPSPPAAVSSPPPPAAPVCVLNSSLPECAKYIYPLESIVADITNLCTAMPYMPGCAVGLACQTRKVTGLICAPFSLLASICADMPGMGGCRAYRTLCAASSVVQQCAAFPAIPGLPSTKVASAAVDTICLANPEAPPCATCTQMACPDFLAALAGLCRNLSGAEACAPYRQWCLASQGPSGLAGDLSAFCPGFQPDAATWPSSPPPPPPRSPVPKPMPKPSPRPGSKAPPPRRRPPPFRRTAPRRG
ncbi:hypothetical protein GPECTOR_12g549 [Gonium pectorale]|uniref:Uncharacterized protein n=1 Tax=Gonium pectorale TaxID=33097 RepID=A0A150GP00_GONPE|nr:hypothetical protein GPECTOR_12g549 [Gonium pectorale]|eukprot:KXZ51586.1 hypothetical protein GPECTOR_12g549 [Gonium pectorale]